MANAPRVYEVMPHIGIGPLRLGMTPAEVRAAVPGHAVMRIGRGREEMIDTLGLNVDYSERDTAVTFIQAFPVSGVRFTYRGLDVFALPADEVVTAIVRGEELAPDNYPLGTDEYEFPTLRLALWREFVGEVPGEQGWGFSSISVYMPDYYES